MGYGPSAYEMLVLAADVGDIVVSVGGWLCDRACAGWRITAAVPNDSDSRPLDILGVKATSPDSACEVMRDSPPHALAVSSAVLAADEFVRNAVRKAFHENGIELSYWRDSFPPHDNPRQWVVQHRLTDLSRAFKSEAVKAAFTVRVHTAPIEVFHCAAPRSRTSVLRQQRTACLLRSTDERREQP